MGKYFLGKAYKFTSLKTLESIIESEKLRFTRPSSFNDPLESNSFLLPIDWGRLVKSKGEPQKPVRYTSDLIQNNEFKMLYISCFCKNYLNIKSTLMWSHYADNHRGICFEVDFSNENSCYALNASKPVNVTYVSSLVKERNKRTIYSEDLRIFLTTYKLKIWDYEQEVRIVLERNSLDKTKYLLQNDGNNIDVMFNIKSIKKVIFGCQTTEDDWQRIITLFMSKNHIPKFSKIDINPVSIRFTEVDLGIDKLKIQLNYTNSN